MQKLYTSRANGPQREEKEDNNESGCNKAILTRGLQREKNGDNKQSGCRGYKDQGPAEGGEGRR